MDNPDQEFLARLREAEVQRGFVAQLQATLNVIPAHTWYAAPSGDLTFVNKRTADYLGLPNDHPLRFGIDIGAQWDAHIPLLHPDDQEESRKACQPVRARARPLSLEPISKFPIAVDPV